jgi:peptidoglycan/xylan/chitin deacetylase (PgdA/CDA1 family)
VRQPPGDALKRLAKRTAAGTLGRLRFDGGRRLVVLCYHSIHPRSSFASASPERFDEHLGWLRAHCDVVSLHELSARRTAAPSPRPVVAITFDDGYEDNHTYALPALVRHACPATFFVTVGLVERDPVALERLRSVRNVAADEIAPLSWSQVGELRSAGLAVGGHTWSHPNLARLGGDEVRTELRRSTSLLEERLGERVEAFAYPFGKPGAHFTKTTASIVASEGYDLAVSVVFRSVRRSDDAYAIPRFFVTGDTVDVLAAKVNGEWDWLGAWQERAPARLRRLVSPADFRV